MAELTALNVLTNGGRKSLQQINTSLDDDSILDIINTSKRKQLYLHRDEPDSPSFGKSPKRKKKLVRIFTTNHQRKSSKSRESRRDRDSTHRKHSYHHMHHATQSAHSVTMYSRSKSMPRIKTETTVDDSATPSVPKRTRRFAAWFDKLNNSTPAITPSRSEAHSFKNLVRQSSMKILTNIPSNRETDDVVSPTVTDYSSTTNGSPPAVSNILTTTGNQGRYMHQKILWRPNLKEIYRDKQLLEALVAFMERIYCEENILFLQAVHEFKYTIDQYIDTDEKQSQIEHTLSDKIKRDIDFKIVSIYNEYVVSNAQSQVNLSYECFNNALARRAAVADINLHQKREIFDIAVTEIERLINTSVLGSFYDSAEFAVVATQRPQPRPKMHSKSSPVPKQKKSRNPFSRMRTSSKKSKYDDDEEENSEEVLDLNDESVSYDEDVDVAEPYANSVPTPSLDNHSNQTPIKLYNAYEAEFTFPKRTESEKRRTFNNYSRKRGDSNSRYSYNKRSSNVNTPLAVSSLPEHNRPSSPVSCSTSTRLSLTLSQSHTQSENHLPYCNVNGNNNAKRSRGHTVSPRFGDKDHRNGFHHSAKSEPDGSALHVAEIQQLKDGESVKSSQKKYKSANTKAVRTKEKEREKEKRQKKRKKMKRKKRKKKKKKAADDANFMCKRKKHIKLAKLKDATKLNMRKRRKSNNDSDILMKLYREPKKKHSKKSRVHNSATSVDIV